MTVYSVIGLAYHQITYRTALALSHWHTERPWMKQLENLWWYLLSDIVKKSAGPGSHNSLAELTGGRHLQLIPETPRHYSENLPYFHLSHDGCVLPSFWMLEAPGPALELH